MFICDPCLKKYYDNAPSIGRYTGTCESCRKSAECSELPSEILRVTLRNKEHDTPDSPEEIGCDEHSLRTYNTNLYKRLQRLAKAANEVLKLRRRFLPPEEDRVWDTLAATIKAAAPTWKTGALPAPAPASVQRREAVPCLSDARIGVLASRAGGHPVGAPCTRNEERSMAVEIQNHRRREEMTKLTGFKLASRLRALADVAACEADARDDVRGARSEGQAHGLTSAAEIVQAWFQGTSTEVAHLEEKYAINAAVAVHHPVRAKTLPGMLEAFRKNWCAPTDGVVQPWQAAVEELSRLVELAEGKPDESQG